MVQKPSSKDILAFRVHCGASGIDLSNLTDEQLARQILILRGGLYRPTRRELRGIRDRSKLTDPIFERNDHEVIGLLQDALSDFRSMQSQGSSRGRKRYDGKPAETFDRRLERLQAALIAYPTSILRPALGKALREISSWTSPHGPARSGILLSQVTSNLRRWLRDVKTIP